LGFDKSYEVCNCKKVTIAEIENVIKNLNASTLREIQDITTAGTECRHCIFPEGDFGKIKKNIYCKDILNEFKKEIING
jgi:bacterioferritin-associated ferredoxin